MVPLAPAEALETVMPVTLFAMLTVIPVVLLAFETVMPVVAEAEVALMLVALTPICVWLVAPEDVKPGRL